MYSNFKKQLIKYQPYEKIAAEKIALLNNVSLLSFCDNYKYDFETSDNLKYEVKTDEASNKTNNIFIEFYGYNKPSGITTTEANFYIINDTFNYYLISVDNLRELIINNKCRKIETKQTQTYGYLLSKNILINNSILI